MNQATRLFAFLAGSLCFCAARADAGFMVSPNGQSPSTSAFIYNGISSFPPVPITGGPLPFMYSPHRRSVRHTRDGYGRRGHE